MKKKIRGLGLFLFLGFLSTCFFPILNISELGARKMGFLDWYIIFFSLLGCHFYRKIQDKILSNKSEKFILVFDLLAVLTGLLVRYMIEYGEVSNSYNFTGPNILFHTLVYTGMSWGFWSRLEKNR